MRRSERLSISETRIAFVVGKFCRDMLQGSLYGKSNPFFFCRKKDTPTRIGCWPESATGTVTTLQYNSMKLNSGHGKPLPHEAVAPAQHPLPAAPASGPAAASSAAPPRRRGGGGDNGGTIIAAPSTCLRSFTVQVRRNRRRRSGRHVVPHARASTSRPGLIRLAGHRSPMLFPPITTRSILPQPLLKAMAEAPT